MQGKRSTAHLYFDIARDIPKHPARRQQTVIIEISRTSLAQWKSKFKNIKAVAWLFQYLKVQNLFIFHYSPSTYLLIE